MYGARSHEKKTLRVGFCGVRLSADEAKKAALFWGPTCFLTGLSADSQPLSLAMVDPALPPAWQNLVPVARRLAKDCKYQLPALPPALQTKWRSALRGAGQRRFLGEEDINDDEERRRK